MWPATRFVSSKFGCQNKNETKVQYLAVYKTSVNFLMRYMEWKYMEWTAFTIGEELYVFLRIDAFCKSNHILDLRMIVESRENMYNRLLRFYKQNKYQLTRSSIKAFKLKRRHCKQPLRCKSTSGQSNSHDI